MKITDEQRQRIAEAMGLVVEGERARDTHIVKLAAGMREAAKLDYFKYDSWPNDITSSCVLDNVADCLEEK